MMRTRFDEQLSLLDRELIGMGALCEEAIAVAAKALLDGDAPAAARVGGLEQEIDRKERDIETLCLRLLLQQQPVARDLRQISAALKMITDLERIGDEAQKVARMGKTILLADRVHMPRFREIQKMAEVALAMLRRALDAFARLDVAGALDVARQDRKLDEEFDANFRQLVTFMMEDPRAISMSIDTIFMCKAIERIGDHAKNISEYVVYLVKGKDIRHTALEDVERIEL